VLSDYAGLSEEERIQALRAYLAQRPEPPPPPPVPGGALIRRLPGWLPARARHTGTRVVRPWSRHKLRAAQQRSPLRLHLGSGRINKPDWVNIDLVLAKADIAWNLVTGIPFRTGSVDAIFHEHVFEHIEVRDGYAFAQECLRVLKPGGILRIGIPDAGALLHSYAGTADPEWANSKPTPMLAVTGLFYEHDHRAMYDEETLRLLLHAAGFADTQRCEYATGWLQPSPDSEHRRSGTLYVEARKAPAD
jgi:predicted SAM-dependent methyltransferase